MGGKLIRLHTNPIIPYYIVDVVKIPLRSEWHDSIFKHYDKMAKSTTFSAPFLRSLLSPV